MWTEDGPQSQSLPCLLSEEVGLHVTYEEVGVHVTYD